MSVQNALIEMFSGDSKILRYTVKDGSGAVINITGAAFRWGLFKLDTDESTPPPKPSTLLPTPGETPLGPASARPPPCADAVPSPSRAQSGRGGALAHAPRRRAMRRS